MKSKMLRSILGVGLFGVMVVSMQNCGQPGSLVLNQSNSGNSDNSSTEPAPDSNAVTPTTDVVQQPAIASFDCKKFVALSAADELEIPERDDSGTCYTLKIFDAIAESNSNLTALLDDDVISRDHDPGSDMVYQTRHPYLMGKAIVNFKLKSLRNIQLSGSADSLAGILVDNFIMTAVHPRSVPVAAEYFKAYGSKDATIYPTTNIKYRGADVPLSVFAQGGISTLDPLDITDYVEVDKSFSLEVRAQDCGSTRALSDVYLLFR